MPVRITYRYPTIVALAITAELLAGTAACTRDAANDLPPPAPPPASSGETPEPVLAPAEQAAVTEARAKVDEFMNSYLEVSTAEIPTAETAEDLFFRVDKHLAGVLSQELRGEIIGRWGARHSVTGALEWQFIRTLEVELDREVDGSSFPQVNLLYCVDATDWSVTGADAGDPAGVAGSESVWRLAVSWSDDWFGQGIEGWRVVERAVRDDQPC